MISIDKQVNLVVARDTGVFSVGELKVLEEVLESSRHIDETQYLAAAPDYVIFEEKRDQELAGFVIFGRTPLTHSTWDIYWVVVDKKYQGRGVGSHLMKRIENYVTNREGFATIRLETSSRKEYLGTRIFYGKNGFKEAGRIPDFYTCGDDLVIFFKKMEPQIDEIMREGAA